ncbi:hypothetical protein [Bradyrhizobium sp. SZCCHNRI1003]|uniref:hypothetical protein n=1 Tax=Bradyrhizobium sp. SZCCHNRI1003 TaxID=3057275 RepID=UPI0029171126|nr:hypothetical protein [Bradyrhizobium sp. SZCCHNRI1003]
MERWQFIRWGIAASVLAHIVIAALIFLSTGVRRFEPPAPEVVAVDIVDPDEPAKAPEPAPSPSPTPDLALPKPDVSPNSAASASAAAPAPQPAPTPTRETKAQPPSQPQPQPKAPAQAEPQTAAPAPTPMPTPSAAPSYVPPEPDLTVKYGVMLGLPPPLPPLPASGNGADESKDAGPSASTNLAANLTGPFRQHLRSCSKLPPSVSRSDNIMVKLRVIMTPDGRLAVEPDLIEGDVNNPLKALELKKAAIAALAVCQPYTMLPRDRYREWQVLELSFTPQDFVD